MHFPNQQHFRCRVEVDARWFRLARMMNEGFRDKKSEWRSGPIEANGIRPSQATMTVGKLFVTARTVWTATHTGRPLGNGEHLTRGNARHPTVIPAHSQKQLIKSIALTLLVQILILSETDTITGRCALLLPFQLFCYSSCYRKQPTLYRNKKCIKSFHTQMVYVDFQLRQTAHLTH